MVPGASRPEGRLNNQKPRHPCLASKSRLTNLYPILDKLVYLRYKVEPLMKSNVAPDQYPFDRIREALADILAMHDDCGRPVSIILRQLGTLERTFRRLKDLSDGPLETDGKKRNKPKTYEVRKVRGRERLLEYRFDSDLPFSCSKVVFDALLRVLVQADEPLNYQAIQERLEKSLGKKSADYQIRVGLRFMTSPEVALARRSRTRYTIQKKKGAKARANLIWSQHIKDRR